MSSPAVLIVEDEAIVALDLQTTLQDLGYDAFAIAASADEAIAAASARLPDVVLMDIRIKGEHDGVVTADILTREFRVPIVYLTSHADDTTVARASRTMPYGYLQKPVRGGELRSAIEVALYKCDMERRALEQKRWFEATLTSIGDAVMTVDLAGKVTFLNQAAQVMCGVAAAEAIGRHASDILRLRDAPSPITQAIETGNIQNLKRAELERSDGSHVVIADSAAPVISEGKMLGAVMVFRDITEDERLQQRIELTDRLASLGTLAAGVAHEINNPLAAVVANAELVNTLLNGTDFSQESLDTCREAVADIEQASMRVAGIVKDLRTFARPLLSTSEKFDLRRCVDWAVRSTRHEFVHRAKVTVGNVNITGICGEETRIGQVLINLLTNASHAIPPGRAAENEVHIHAIEDETMVRITVKDTGCGMSEETKKRLFEPFYTTKKVGSGTGLGMSVSHGIVVACGGTIEVESTKGEGTSITVVLPRSRDDEPSGTGIPKGNEAAPGRRLRVLVVDDEAIILRSVVRMLDGHEVVTCEDGEGAIALLKNDHAFDIILCDVTMPNGTGDEVYGEILTSFPTLARRVVFMTGGAVSSSIGRFLERHTHRTLAKPFSGRELRALVHLVDGTDTAEGRPGLE